MTASRPQAPLPGIELNWEGFLSNIRREKTPDRVYYFEHGVADNVLEAVAGQYDLWAGLEGPEPEKEWRRREAAHAFLGHELFRVFPGQSRITIPKREGDWVEEGKGAITTWEEFEQFPWPDPTTVDYSVLEYFEKHLHPEMRVFNLVEVWEVVVGLFGFESLCYALYEDRDLVDAMFQKAGEFALKVAETVCDFKCYGAAYLADDLAFKTSMFMDPKTLRELVLPWHKRIADLAHAKGKLFFLHCCGDMYPLIDDYINDLKIDAKHSFEEAVVPVTEVKRRYGDRITLLGGMDVDFLARGKPDAIEAKTREILDVCHTGGYCLGSGNWVTAYIPPENYLSMLRAGRNYA